LPLIQLLQSAASFLKFLFRRSLRLLDKGMKNHNLLILDDTEKHPPNPFFPFGSNLKQTVTHRRSMRFPKGRSKVFNQFQNVQEVSQNAGGESLYLGHDLVIEECDLP